MASWPELREYIAAHCTMAGEPDDIVALDLRCPNGRTQLATITHVTLVNGAEHWAVIESVFAKVGAVDLNRAALLMATMVCGGIGVAEDRLTLRHAIPTPIST